MKIAVLSDIHSNLVNLGKAKVLIDKENAEAVFCCGDIASEDVLIEFKRWKMPVYLTWGNADIALREKMADGKLDCGHVQVFDEYGDKEIAERKIAFTHTELMAGKLAGTGKYDLVLYGHDHKPWVKKHQGVILVNPGEVSGEFGPPSFALCNLDEKIEPELKIII